jgi:hypothetical protein
MWLTAPTFLQRDQALFGKLTLATNPRSNATSAEFANSFACS